MRRLVVRLHLAAPIFVCIKEHGGSLRTASYGGGCVLTPLKDSQADMRKGVSRIVLGRPFGRALVYLRTIGLWRCFRNLVQGIPTDVGLYAASE